MKRKLLCLLLVMCMLISRLPVKVSASPSYELSIGGTDVTYYNNVISYWKADGDGNYSNTGNESDYDFSVSYNSDTERFTLTLNGVEIATSGEDYGIKCNASLDIILADGTENRINTTSYGVSADNGITIEGQGNLEITSGDAIGLESLDGGIDIYSGTIVISGASGVFAHEYINIEGGSVTAIATDEDGECFYTYGSLGSMTAPFSYRFKTNTSASEPETDYTYCPPETYANTSAYKYVKIEELKEVYIGSTLVSDTADEVSYWRNDGDGGITPTDADENNYNAEYDKSSNTLTLNGLDLTDFYNTSSYGAQESCGIYSTVPLNIFLADGSNNSINTVTNENARCMNIKAGGDITVGGSGTLSLHTEKNIDTEESSNTCGIFSSGGGIAVTGGEITVTANNTDDFCGLYAKNGVAIEGGSVDINTNNAYGFGIVTDSGDVIVSGSETYLNINFGNE